MQRVLTSRVYASEFTYDKSSQSTERNGLFEYRRYPLNNDVVRMISASGILGYGFPESSLKAGLERKPHMIGVDGGSSDPGPHYLGSGKTFTNPLSIKRDLSLLLRGAV